MLTTNYSASTKTSTPTKQRQQQRQDQEKVRKQSFRTYEALVLTSSHRDQCGQGPDVRTAWQSRRKTSRTRPHCALCKKSINMDWKKGTFEWTLDSPKIQAIMFQNLIRHLMFMMMINETAHLTLSSSLSLSLRLSHSHDLSDHGPFHSPLRQIFKNLIPAAAFSLTSSIYDCDVNGFKICYI